MSFGVLCGMRNCTVETSDFALQFLEELLWMVRFVVRGRQWGFL